MWDKGEPAENEDVKNSKRHLQTRQNPPSAAIYFCVNAQQMFSKPSCYLTWL